MWNFPVQRKCGDGGALLNKHVGLTHLKKVWSYENFVVPICRAALHGVTGVLLLANMAALLRERAELGGF